MKTYCICNPTEEQANQYFCFTSTNRKGEVIFLESKYNIFQESQQQCGGNLYVEEPYSYSPDLESVLIMKDPFRIFEDILGIHEELLLVREELLKTFKLTLVKVNVEDNDQFEVITDSFALKQAILNYLPYLKVCEILDRWKLLEEGKKYIDSSNISITLEDIKNNLWCIDNNQIAKENVELKNQIDYQKDCIKTQHETNNELNRQIEKMKCCENCKHYIDTSCEFDLPIRCKYWYTQLDNTTDEWELA